MDAKRTCAEMLLLPATLTVPEARDTLRMLAQALEREKAGPVSVDAGQLVRFDSVALAVLLECQRLAQAFGRGFEVRQAPPKLSALARLYGLESLLLPAPGVRAAEAAQTPGA